MKLIHLEVENFRGIRAASISFSRGLNVLHGPNDLGKSTLAEAIRAALLVPARSVEGRTYVGWDTAAPAHVNLTFERSGKLWRVRKTFGSGFKSVLDQSDDLDSPRFREIAHGSGVEGTLRELLSWGVAPPGGKGQSTKPTSYLVIALLGRQGEVQSIFEASLSDDKADTGKALVTKALGVLAKDPIVSRIVERLSERVDAIFTPGEKFKQAADSPLVKLQEHLKDQEDRLRELKDADTKGKAIEERVVALQTERLQLLAQHQAAESALTAAQEREDRAARKAVLQAVVDECTRHLNLADQLDSELNSLQTTLGEREAKSNCLKVEKVAAEAKLRETQKLMQSASEEVARASAAEAQSVLVADAMRQQRHAELESQKVSAEARLRDLESAMKALSDLSNLERELRNANAAASRTSDEVAKAQLVLEHATLNARVQDLTEKQITAERFAATHERVQQKEGEALRKVSAAQKALAEAIARRDDPEFASSAPEMQEVQAELNLLRAVDLGLRIQAVRDQVRELEAHDARARECRDRALANRSRASQIEQETSRRVLPTKEQIASWRALQIEMEAIPASAAPIRRSPLIPLFVGLAAGLIVMLIARFAVGSATGLTLLASATAAVIVGGSIWTVSRSRARSSAEKHEGHRRLSERWSLEVLPSLRSAGLSGIAEYESVSTDIERRKTEARQLRRDAEEEDLQAAAASQAAASLESRRTELTALKNQESFADNTAFAAHIEEFRNNLSTVRERILDAERRMEATRVRLRRAADAAFDEAAAKLKDQQAAHAVVVTEAATAKAQFEVARQQCDPDGLYQLQQKLDGFPGVSAPAKSVANAKASLEQAWNDASEAAARVTVLQDQLGTMQPKAAQLVSPVGEDPSAKRQKAKASLAEVIEQLKSLESAPRQGISSDIKALADARQKLAELEGQVAIHKQALESATAALSDADEVIAKVRNDIASKQGELKAIDRFAIEAKRQAALADPVFQVPHSEGISLASAIEALNCVKRTMDECDRRLNAAKGQLHLVAGHVGAERLAQQEETVRYARDEVLDRERTELAALRLLNEIRSVEAAQTSHLGRTLAGPITDSFQELTRGRYGQLGLDPDLKIQTITASGAGREVSDLSVGTREQLATLIRLAIAGHLQTAVILDDQLVHSDPEKLNWFRQQLRASSERGHQIIVFTCRPADYFPLGTAGGDHLISVVDLASAISRSKTLTTDKVYANACTQK